MTDLVFVDFETTGLNPFDDEIIEASIMRATHNEILDRQFEYTDIKVFRIMPDHPDLAFRKPFGSQFCAADINGFSVEKWKSERGIYPIYTWEQFIEESILLFHGAKWCGANAQFDYMFYLHHNNRYNMIPPKLGDYHLCDLSTFGHLLKETGRIEKASLDSMAGYFGFSRSSAIHSSVEDIFLTALVYGEIHSMFGRNALVSNR